MSVQQADLESPFYRVATRLLVFDDSGRLLVVENDENEYEIPGGGWEYGETFEECLRRESLEELGVDILSFSDIKFVYRARNVKSYWSARLFVEATLAGYDFKPGDDMVAAEFVTKEEFLQLRLCPDEGDLNGLAALIWPVEKNAKNR